MDQNINLKQGKTTYDITNYGDGTVGVFCTKSVVLNIYDKAIEFVAGELAVCAKDDTFNESFGKALAWIRASKDIGNQVENYLIKYSCKPNSKIGDLNIKVKLNTEEFEKSLKKLSNKVEDLNNQIKGRTFENLYKDASLTIDLGDIDEAKIKLLKGETTLDKLVGKWAMRNKPAINDRGYEDGSWMDGELPIYIFRSLTSDFAYKYKNCDTVRDMPKYFLDDNWIEYKKEVI